MKCILINLFFILSLSFVFAGNGNYPLGARSSGMGNIGLTNQDVWAVQYNQAGLAGVKLITGGVSYESRFTQKDLSIQSFAFAIPTKKSGTFGVRYSGFGGKLYRENKFSLAYAMKFSPKISGGISINYHGLTIANNYGNKSSFTFDAGIIAQITEKIRLGAHVFNPTQTKLNDYQQEIIPVILGIGMRYTFSQKVFAAIEIEKDIDFSPVIKAGMEYHPIDMLYLRAGISTNPSMPSIGFGVDLKQFRFDFSSTFHPVLGVTPAFSLLYSFDKK